MVNVKIKIKVNFKVMIKVKVKEWLTSEIRSRLKVPSRSKGIINVKFK